MPREEDGKQTACPLPSRAGRRTMPGMTPARHENEDPRGKGALRAEMRAKRQALGARERLERSRAAARHVLQSLFWKNARTVALYVAVRGEMDTNPLLRAAWQKGKRVLLPLCRMEGAVEGAAEMRLVPCRGPEMLVPGAFGIPEPACPTDEHARSIVPDLIIVPGVAFDRKGVRLGQGGGWYDRYFFRPEAADILRLGFAYAFQIVERLPRDPWDALVDGICTEQGIVWTARQ